MERIHQCCSFCGKKTTAIHDYRNQVIKDIPAFGKLVVIHLRKRRSRCSCGKRIGDSQSSRIKKFFDCAKTIINWSIGTLNSFDCPYTNGFTEGCNNKIKVLKRNAYGYRNFNRFRNRILHVFNNKISEVA